MPSADVMALRILMGPEKGRQAKLTALANQVKAYIENRVECPECGSMGPHDDNGCRASELVFCCTSCGCHFDAC